MVWLAPQMSSFVPPAVQTKYIQFITTKHTDKQQILPFLLEIWFNQQSQL